MQFILSNAAFLLDNIFSEDHSILIKNNEIEGIYLNSEVPTGVPTINLEGCFVIPGLIDLQVNGFAGFSLNPEISEEDLKSIHDSLLQEGCSSYLPTLISAPFASMKKSLKAVEHAQKYLKSALPGVHFEGPYINPEKKGIHCTRFIRKPDSEEIKEWIRCAQSVALMTVAPEQCSKETLNELRKSGIRLAIGHSLATYEQTLQSIEWGVEAVTHIFNAMPGLTSREPGIVGAALECGNLFTCCIADGLHIKWPTLKVASRCILPEYLCLVTDALAGAKSTLSNFAFAEKMIYVHDGVCVDKSGRLAGSCLTPLQAIRNAVHFLDLPLASAVQAFSANPARLLGQENKIGHIKSGALANLAVLGKDLSLYAMMFEGEWKVLPKF